MNPNKDLESELNRGRLAKDGYTSLSKRREGEAAFKAGKPRSENPYKEGSEAASLWARGYNDAQTQARKGEDSAKEITYVWRVSGGWAVRWKENGQVLQQILLDSHEAQSEQEALQKAKHKLGIDNLDFKPFAKDASPRELKLAGESGLANLKTINNLAEEARQIDQNNRSGNAVWIRNAGDVRRWVKQMQDAGMNMPEFVQRNKSLVGL